MAEFLFYESIDRTDTATLFRTIGLVYDLGHYVESTAQ